MNALSTVIVCDGCGLPASAEHVAERIKRLELATRYRPIHINLLFVLLQPMPRVEDDFYGPPELRDFFDLLMGALGISADLAKPRTAQDRSAPYVSQLLEFQRRGYFLAYLSECPAKPPSPATPSAEESAARDCVSRLAPTFIKRIQFNYKPKNVALLGTHLQPLAEILGRSDVGPLMLLDHGRPLVLPRANDASSLALFRRTVLVETRSTIAPSGV
jgi:hypothetical protein